MNVYLETRGRGATRGGVEDVGRRGLSDVSEVAGIVVAILQDYVRGVTRDRHGNVVPMTRQLALRRLRFLRDRVLPRLWGSNPSRKRLRVSKKIVNLGISAVKRGKSHVRESFPRIVQRITEMVKDAY